jgi:ABC-2 type transport system permease protein
MPEPTGVIHDIGYQRYTGPRLGRRQVFGALYLHGLRTAFGLGRSAKAKIFPWLVVGIVTLVAAGVTAVRSQIGEVVMTYAQFAGCCRSTSPGRCPGRTTRWPSCWR